MFHFLIAYGKREIRAGRIIPCSKIFKFVLPCHSPTQKLYIGYDYKINNIALNILCTRVSSKGFRRSSIYDAANVARSLLLSWVYWRNFRLTYGGMETSYNESHVASPSAIFPTHLQSCKIMSVSCCDLENYSRGNAYIYFLNVFIAFVLTQLQLYSYGANSTADTTLQNPNFYFQHLLNINHNVNHFKRNLSSWRSIRYAKQ
jgi:hypothetical protein